MGRDDGSNLEDVSNPNHDGSPPNEITVEDEEVQDVYYKETMVDSYNTITPPIRDLIPPFKTVPALQLSSLKTCNQVTILFAEAPYIGLNSRFFSYIHFISKIIQFC